MTSVNDERCDRCKAYHQRVVNQDMTKDIENVVADFCKEFQADRGYGTSPQFVGGAFDINDYTDWLRTALTAMYEKGLRDGREPYIIRDVAIDLRAQVSEGNNQ
jgi:hypothetical protein